jgi:hypothetical protein
MLRRVAIGSVIVAGLGVIGAAVWIVLTLANGIAMLPLLAFGQ